jgi:hypothetical protein
LLVSRDLRQEGADDLLGPSPCVDVCRIDGVAAAIQEPLEDGVRLFFVAPPIGGAERHGSKRDTRDQQARDPRNRYLIALPPSSKTDTRLGA